MKITKELLAKAIHESMYGEDGEFGSDCQWLDPASMEYFNLSGAYESNPETYRKHMEIAAQRALDKVNKNLSLSDEDHIKNIKDNWAQIKGYISQSHDMPDIYFLLTGIRSDGFCYDYLVVHPQSMSSFAVLENHFGNEVISIFRVYPALNLHISQKKSNFNLYAQDILKAQMEKTIVI